MENFKVENLSFTYPNRKKAVVKNVSFSVNQGEFVLICGKSGCGKTTLLRLLKSSLSPTGEIKGNIFFGGKLLDKCDAKEQATAIGFVMQNPDNQIVCDKVWHELAFGLESVGYTSPEIRARVSEMASFFGIQTWFHQKTTELSGGQKQLLNLASVMVMQPSVLILDEPTSQLDPIAAGEFLKMLEKINRELGTTVILAEHRLEDAFPMADRVIVLDEGKIIEDGNPCDVGRKLKHLSHDMYKALPVPVRVYSEIQNSHSCPLTVREGRKWLEEYSKENILSPDKIPTDASQKHGENIIEVCDVWFRYEKNSPDVIKGINMSVQKGEMFCLLGGNGTGKTTMLSLISGLNVPYRGKILINGQNISDISHLYRGMLGVLPQNPQSIFVKKTVYLDLIEMLSESDLTHEEKEKKIQNIALLCKLENVLDSHSYDLSGGEQQRAALAKILLVEPQILILDEPTKGMDASFKEEFADILSELKSNGVTILMVSHDIEFCAEYADRCALVFDGSIATVGAAREFFKGKSFYTTAANRMARTVLPDAILSDDIIIACGGNIQKKEKQICKNESNRQKSEIKKPDRKIRQISPIRIICGSILAMIFLLMSFPGFDIVKGFNADVVQIISMMGAFFCFFSKRDKASSALMCTSKTNCKVVKKNLAIMLLMLLLIFLTIYVGRFIFNNRKYYFISLLIIIETIIPFILMFESRRPKARELVVVSVLCALAVASRAAFSSLPQFKPVVAVIIISGVCFGGETGFLVGAVTGFVSNFFLGQGPWTPWQMFALGIIGFIAGVLFGNRLVSVNKMSLCIFGFVVTFFVYGGIMNPASVIMWQDKISWKMIVSACVAGVPFDMIHAFSSVFFLWFISEPMIEKLERIKIKYGLIDR